MADGSVDREAARHVVDEERGTGCFIFTGSAYPSDDITRHSGAGRVRRVRLCTMSLAESGESTAAVSLAALLDGETCEAAAPQTTIPEIAESGCRGGWPRHLDLSTPAGLDRQEHVFAGLAQHSGSRCRRRPAVSWAATSGYLDALERVFLVEDLPAWSARLRSRATLQQAPKRHFVDPSLAAAVIGVNPDRLLDGLETWACSLSRWWSRPACLCSRLQGRRLSLSH
ncbi:MAG: DUF4143 domain-containing protein [Acidimicrobiaceae bacterium]|nr:DUF4143 domain-containing protein [Acidimicrobiaceae bacterium]